MKSSSLARIFTLIIFTLVHFSTVSFGQSGLIGSWDFDEGTGTTSADSIRTNTVKILSNVHWTNGISGNALHFSGFSSAAYMQKGAVVGTNADCTVEAWIKWDGTGAAGPQFIYGESAGNDVIDLLLDNGIPKFTVLSSTWSSVAAQTAVTPNEWHHLAGVLQLGAGVIYVDGQPAGTNASMANHIEANDAYVGSYNLSSRFFAGTIDALRVYNVGRSAAEILADAQQYQPVSADLVISQVAEPNRATAGSNLVWTVSVTNAGPTSATDVTVTNVLPAGPIVISIDASPGTWTNNGSSIAWTLGTIAANDIATLSIVLQPGAPGTLTNSCTVNSSSADPVMNNNASELVVNVLGQPPTVMTPLVGQSIMIGGTATFSVGATGIPAPTYQWQLNGTNLVGEVGSTLNVSNLTLAQAGVYSVVVSNEAGSVTNSANLLVLDLKFYAGLNIGGPTGITYRVEYASEVDTNQWTTLTNIVPDTTPYLFIDKDSPGKPKGFYRAVPLP